MKLLLASLAALPLLVGAAPVHAQGFNRLTNMFGGDDNAGEDRGAPDRGGGGYERGGAPSSDSAALEVRLGKLEGRIREMTGQIEELQNDNRKLVQQVQRFQQDVDSRLSSGAAHSTRRSDAAPTVPEKVATPEPESAAPKRRAGRDDAYDPDTAPKTNPGRPKPLGSVASAEESAAAPMDLSGGRLRRSETAPSDTIEPTLKLPKIASTAPDSTATSSGAPTSPRAAFDQALGFYKGKQYEEAEKGFSTFIQKNPKSRLAADATYYLGESFQQRGRSREAAEQYLKVSKDYANSSRAPDAMLHLGVSLKSLGAKEQACATFTEVGRKYPNAPAYVKSGVERESKRAQCG